MKDLNQTDYQDLIDSCNQLYESFKPSELEGNLQSLRSELADGSIWQDNSEVATNLNQQLSHAEKQFKSIIELKNYIENLQIALELQDQEQIDDVLVMGVQFPIS